MNKTALYVGLMALVGIIGFLIYRFMLNPTQVYSTTSLNPFSQANNGQEHNYPFAPAQTPRADNSNQPWANNNRGQIAQVSMPQIDVNVSNLAMFAEVAGSVKSISDSVGSLWEDWNVSSWFSDGDPGAVMQDMDMSRIGWESGI